MTYTIQHKQFSWLFWLAPSAGTVIGNTIYFPERWFSLSEPEHTAWLEHEKKHIDQALNWWSYLTNKSYRRAVETDAYRIQVQYLLAHGKTPRVEEWASILADSYGPLKWIEREEAITILKGWIEQ